MTAGESTSPDETAAQSGHTTRTAETPPQAGARRTVNAAAASYQLVRLLGSGAFGDVYEAIETSMRRSVALKLIKPGMIDAEILARFEIEMRALAQMSHPAIATVYASGTTDDGLPFFAMQLVRGAPINRYCDEHRLSIEDRVRIVSRIADAIQHAHFKGFIHRDIKPSNLLVEARPDGSHAPTVIDFGVAKALQRALFDEHHAETYAGAFIGTPSYAAPEQAAGEGASAVDTRTDVYALGVVLYELLTGVLPLDLKGLGPAESLSKIASAERPAPATRLRRSDEPRLSESRQTTRAKLLRTLRGDLGRIIRRCLELRPEDRYTSPTELASDLARYLEGDPVSVGPRGPWYHAAKYVRRHRARVTIAAGVATLATAGVVGTAWGLVRERDALRIAQAQSEIVLRNRDRLEAADLLATYNTMPLTADGIPAMQHWLTRRDALLQRLPGYELQLADLESRATANDVMSERVEDLDTQRRGESAWVEALGRSRAAIDDPASASAVKLGTKTARDRARAAYTSEIERRERRIAAIDAVRARAPRCAFDDPADGEAYQELCEMLGDVAAIETGGATSFVRARLANAQSIDELATDLWDAAIASIADQSESPRYGGLVITPQPGLQPLWRNAQSGLWEFWHAASGDRPVRDESGRVVVRPETGMVLVLIPGGVFRSGAQSVDAEGDRYDPAVSPVWSAESLGDPVALDPYFISKFEMTQGQYLRLTDRQPSEIGPGVWGSGLPAPADLTHPVESVSAEESQRALVRWGLTLPTAAQWERAARGETGTPYWFGDDAAGAVSRSNYLDAGSNRGSAVSERTTYSPGDDGYRHHAPVSSFEPNPFGLHHVLGNVWEWTADAHASSAGRLLSVRSGDGARTIGLPRTRVYRGGGFESTLRDLRVTAVRHRLPTGLDETIGVRPAARLLRVR